MKRKQFITKSILGAAATTFTLASCNSGSEKDISAPNLITSKKFKWKMVTTWPPNFPVLGEGCIEMAKYISTMSNGRLEINVYGGGELIPALESFEAVSSGAVEMGHGAAYYWAGKNPAMQFFTTVPFGLNAVQMNAWIFNGGGMELWKEIYAKYNLIPFPAGSTGIQMAGWFNKEINTINDFKGLKMRIPGFGAGVLTKAGGSAILSAASEIYTNLERGVIDATEWIGPYHDYIMGFHKIAKYYYAPGWHEPGPILDLFVNKRAYEGLPADLQEIIKTAATRMHNWCLGEFETKNSLYLQKIINESDVEVRILSKEILDRLKVFTDESIEDLIAKSPDSKKVFTSFEKFRKDMKFWAGYSEKLYHNIL